MGATAHAPDLRRFLSDSRDDGADVLSFARFARGRVLCRAWGRPSMRVYERLREGGCGRDELLRLERLWSLLAPFRVGYFHEWGPTQRHGWCFAAEIPVERARALAPPGWPSQRLGLFCGRHDIRQLSELAQTVDGSGQVRVRVPLPEGLPAALDAFATLCAPPPPRALWELLDRASLELDVALDDNDAELRLRVTAPDEALVGAFYAALGRRSSTPPRLGPPVALWIEPHASGCALAAELNVRR
jgi:hypothetical protein